MAELYWITTLGTISEFCVIFSVILILVFLVSLFTWIGGKNDLRKCKNEETKEYVYVTRKIAKTSGIALIFAFLGALFIPSKQDLYIIYGLGSTIDYLKENPDAKQLPDKCIKALDIWLDKQIEE